MKVDFYNHRLGPDDADAVRDVLASPFLTTGSVAGKVEEQLRAYFDVPHALLCNSWTNGALAILLAMEIGPDDEVIVPAMTFIASANIVEMTGATTVLVDVDPETFLLTPEIVAAAITPQTRAVIPVHLYGQMVDVRGMRAAMDAARLDGQNIHLIEDCAHCFEGKRDSYRPGKHSDAAIFSFYATKNVTCGEGGAIILRNTDLFDKVRETRLHGMSAIAAQRFEGNRYNHWDMHRLGTKANLPDLLAALLPRQIAEIDTILPDRTAIANRYVEGLAGLSITLPKRLQSCVHAWHLFTIGVPEADRDTAIETLNAAGISVTVNYRALPDLSYYGKRYPLAAQTCPNALAWGRSTITLPLYPGLPRDQQDHVIKVLAQQVAPKLTSNTGLRGVTTIVILQSNYIPWRGYFDLIQRADHFVFYDTAQFTKGDWRNRNRILGPQGPIWLTVPTATANRFGQAVDEVRISDPKWHKRHLGTLQAVLARGAFFRENLRPVLADWYGEMSDMDNLSTVNRFMIERVMEQLSIKTPLHCASQLPQSGDRTGRLVSICKHLGATRYLSGPAAQSYLELAQFDEAGIEVEWMSYRDYPQYEQHGASFDPQMSVLEAMAALPLDRVMK